MAVYVAHMFYSSVAEAAAPLTEVAAEIKSIAGTNLRKLSSGANSAAIAFISDLPPDILSMRFRGITDTNMQFLVTRIDAIAGGWLTQGSLEWLVRYLPRDSKK